MHHRPRTAVLVCILLLIMGGLYMSDKFVGASDEPTATSSPQIVRQSDEDMLREISRGDASQKQVIFTFDAGSGAASVSQILETLRDHRVKGTFFMTGQWVHAYPDLARRIVAEGHEVFNHSSDHARFTELSDGEIVTQLEDAERSFASVMGISSQPYFRAPYGARDERVLRVAAQAGYRSIYWSIDAQDWRESEGMTTDMVKHTILSHLQPGMIILMHVGDTITGSILDEVLTTLETRGYMAVSLTQGI